MAEPQSRLAAARLAIRGAELGKATGEPHYYEDLHHLTQPTLTEEWSEQITADDDDTSELTGPTSALDSLSVPPSQAPSGAMHASTMSLPSSASTAATSSASALSFIVPAKRKVGVIQCTDCVESFTSVDDVIRHLDAEHSDALAAATIDVPAWLVSIMGSTTPAMPRPMEPPKPVSLPDTSHAPGSGLPQSVVGPGGYPRPVPPSHRPPGDPSDTLDQPEFHRTFGDPIDPPTETAPLRSQPRYPSRVASTAGPPPSSMQNSPGASEFATPAPSVVGRGEIYSTTRDAYYAQEGKRYAASGGSTAVPNPSIPSNPIGGRTQQPSPSFAHPSPSFAQPSPSFAQPSFAQPSPSFAQPSPSFAQPPFAQPYPSYDTPRSHAHSSSRSFEPEPVDPEEQVIRNPVIAQPGADQYRCVVCDTHISGELSRRQHLDGAPHRKRVELRRFEYEKRRNASVKSSSAGSTTGSGFGPGSYIDEAEVIQSYGNAQFFCQLCQAAISGIPSLQQHLAGAAHMRKVNQNASNAPHRGNPLDDPDIDKTNAQSEQYYCVICQRAISGFLSLEQHVSGGPHLRAKQMHQSSAHAPFGRRGSGSFSGTASSAGSTASYHNVPYATPVYPPQAPGFNTPARAGSQPTSDFGRSPNSSLVPEETDPGEGDVSTLADKVSRLEIYPGRSPGEDLSPHSVGTHRTSELLARGHAGDDSVSLHSIGDGVGALDEGIYQPVQLNKQPGEQATYGEPATWTNNQREQHTLLAKAQFLSRHQLQQQQQQQQQPPAQPASLFPSSITKATAATHAQPGEWDYPPVEKFPPSGSFRAATEPTIPPASRFAATQPPDRAYLAAVQGKEYLDLGNSQYRCIICLISISGLENLTQHLQGRQHNNKASRVPPLSGSMTGGLFSTPASAFASSLSAGKPPAHAPYTPPYPPHRGSSDYSSPTASVVSTASPYALFQAPPPHSGTGADPYPNLRVAQQQISTPGSSGSGVGGHTFTGSLLGGARGGSSGAGASASASLGASAGSGFGFGPAHAQPAGAAGVRAESEHSFTASISASEASGRAAQIFSAPSMVQLHRGGLGDPNAHAHASSLLPSGPPSVGKSAAPVTSGGATGNTAIRNPINPGAGQTAPSFASSILHPSSVGNNTTVHTLSTVHTTMSSLPSSRFTATTTSSSNVSGESGWRDATTTTTSSASATTYYTSDGHAVFVRDASRNPSASSDDLPNPIAIINEYVQYYKSPNPWFPIVEEAAVAKFEYELRFKGVVTRGTGRSKQEAKKAAAVEAIKELEARHIIKSSAI